MARLLKGEETQQHMHAFEIYYGMGTGRTLGAVAQEMGVSLTAVKGWSRTFNWSRRVEERDAEVANEINRKAVKLAASRKIEYLNMVNSAMEQFRDGIADGSIKVRSIADAERLVNMYIKLIGETQVNQTTVMVITAADIIKAERQVKDGGAGYIDLDISDYSVSEGTDANREDNTVN